MYFLPPGPNRFRRFRNGGLDPALRTGQVEGRVEDLSYWDNELGVIIRGEFWLFYVPDHCPVHCEGRPASVAALRHRDHVRITYSALPTTLVADAIESVPGRQN